jgi:PAS domain S-box-containing protein
LAGKTISAARLPPGGGEMGARIRALDWAGHPLGAVETWPPALMSALGICLNSTFPTAIYWGPDLRLLYNDAWAPIPAERHPWALGRSAKEVWADIWEVVGPQFQNVIDNAAGFTAFEQMLPMQRQGKVGETYWNYSITPILDVSGAVAGVFNQGHEVTEQVFAARARRAETDRLREIFAQATGAIAVLRGADHRIEIANAAYLELVDRGAEVIGQPVADVVPEVVAQGFVGLMDEVFRSGETYIGDRASVQLLRHGARETRIVDFVFQPMRDAAGAVDGIFVQATDVTERTRAEAALAQAADMRSFLDRLAQETQGLRDAGAILTKVTQMTGEHLGVARCAYADMDADGEGFSIRGDWSTKDIKSIVGHYRLSVFGER